MSARTDGIGSVSQAEILLPDGARVLDVVNHEDSAVIFLDGAIPCEVASVVALEVD
jgi:hypothetical protein